MTEPREPPRVLDASVPPAGSHGAEYAHHVLELYVTGMSPASTAAIALVKSTCDDLLPGHYELEVIDIYQAPGRARAEHVVAAPTLVRQRPLPVRRVVGNLSSRVRVVQLLALDASA